MKFRLMVLLFSFILSVPSSYGNDYDGSAFTVFKEDTEEIADISVAEAPEHSAYQVINIPRSRLVAVRGRLTSRNVSVLNPDNANNWYSIFLYASLMAGLSQGKGTKTLAKEFPPFVFNIEDYTPITFDIDRDDPFFRSIGLQDTPLTLSSIDNCNDETRPAVKKCTVVRFSSENKRTLLAIYVERVEDQDSYPRYIVRVVKFKNENDETYSMIDKRLLGRNNKKSDRDDESSPGGGGGGGASAIPVHYLSQASIQKDPKEFLAPASLPYPITIKDKWFPLSETLGLFGLWINLKSLPGVNY
ncbi:hypothetical protein [Endozoicomonas euniceicola]|uniref:Uncharacterized protein n=1 Tax=Endozoicomonas euniceicola TaxID=1234143 RepID=A0ABY6GP66_9GAMM|nr:hypothetical protein [Endozoicomonas euniceicola]UYM14553.1 hypothetical protein NX720_16865 [Endozoicomonas euniceicola]